MAEVANRPLDEGLLREFAEVFASHFTTDNFEVAFQRALEHLRNSQGPAVEINPPPQPKQTKQRLVFKHTCKYFGCRNVSCVLCQNNPDKRCQFEEIFSEYYVINRGLKTRCGANLSVDLVDSETGEVVKKNLTIVISLVDGEAVGVEQLVELSFLAHEVLSNGKSEPLLTSSDANARDHDGRVVVALGEGKCNLPEIKVTNVTEKQRLRSSGEERTVKSFRLLVQAVVDVPGVDLMASTPGEVMLDPNIMPALSGRFKVITQRAMGDRKADYPHMDDIVFRLEHIGNQAVKKLGNIGAELSKLGARVSKSSVRTVAELKELAREVNMDRQRVEKLCQLLNLKHDKWLEICDVLETKTVCTDNVDRVYYVDTERMKGLIFACKQGRADLDTPKGLIEKVVSSENGVQYAMQTLTQDNHPLAGMVKGWLQQAVIDWNKDNHPGWARAPDLPTTDPLVRDHVMVIPWHAQMPSQSPHQPPPTSQPQVSPNPTPNESINTNSSSNPSDSLPAFLQQLIDVGHVIWDKASNTIVAQDPAIYQQIINQMQSGSLPLPSGPHEPSIHTPPETQHMVALPQAFQHAGGNQYLLAAGPAADFGDRVPSPRPLATEGVTHLCTPYYTPYVIPGQGAQSGQQTILVTHDGSAMPTSAFFDPSILAAVQRECAAEEAEQHQQQQQQQQGITLLAPSPPSLGDLPSLNGLLFQTTSLNGLPSGFGDLFSSIQMMPADMEAALGQEAAAVAAAAAAGGHSQQHHHQFQLMPQQHGGGQIHFIQAGQGGHQLHVMPGLHRDSGGQQQVQVTRFLSVPIANANAPGEAPRPRTVTTEYGQKRKSADQDEEEQYQQQYKQRRSVSPGPHQGE